MATDWMIFSKEIKFKTGNQLVKILPTTYHYNIVDTNILYRSIKTMFWHF